MPTQHSREAISVLWRHQLNFVCLFRKNGKLLEKTIFIFFPNGNLKIGSICICLLRRLKSRIVWQDVVYLTASAKLDILSWLHVVRFSIQMTIRMNGIWSYWLSCKQLHHRSLLAVHGVLVVKKRRTLLSLPELSGHQMTEKILIRPSRKKKVTLKKQTSIFLVREIINTPYRVGGRSRR